jgi:hypothetical protein
MPSFHFLPSPASAATTSAPTSTITTGLTTTISIKPAPHQRQSSHRDLLSLSSTIFVSSLSFIPQPTLATKLSTNLSSATQTSSSSHSCQVASLFFFPVPSPYFHGHCMHNIIINFEGGLDMFQPRPNGWACPAHPLKG